jgi:hypothetical protein
MGEVTSIPREVFKVALWVAATVFFEGDNFHRVDTPCLDSTIGHSGERDFAPGRDLVACVRFMLLYVSKTTPEYTQSGTALRIAAQEQVLKAILEQLTARCSK